MLKTAPPSAAERGASPSGQPRLCPGGGTASSSDRRWPAATRAAPLRALHAKHRPPRQPPSPDETWTIYLVPLAKLSPRVSLLPVRLLRSKAQRRKRTLAHFAAPKIPSHCSSLSLYISPFPVPVLPCLSSQTCQNQCVDAPNKSCIV